MDARILRLEPLCEIGGHLALHAVLIAHDAYVGSHGPPCRREQHACRRHRMPEGMLHLSLL
ncbi:hypothetical protein BN940_01466 [Castellaniella defragrans 65Phen]|uniref:Uncharacterized protein n=1 Tax=Castellaniella defragrans (strain DSM 12143 / CCUG 39792 / 65Phen) TaxID=1437824 RepID=W8X8B2_CASD6|nr:hypothetical protein BN940_01466 [Castellaniella defragrans 65Phen]